MTAVLLLTWLVAAVGVALMVGRAIRLGAEPDPEPDWLWDQPTDVLSDAAVDARFAEIVSHFRVLS